MKLVRIVFIALSVLLPTTWTVAMASDPAPAAEKEKKSKTEKTEKTEKAEKPAEKK